MLFIITAALLLVGVILPKGDIFDIPNAKACIMLTSAEKAIKEELDFVDSGADAVVEFEDISKAKDCYQKLSPKSIIFTFDSQNVQKAQDFLSISSSSIQNLENMTIIYGYTSKFNDSVMIDGKKVNVQIVIKQSEALIGFPLIMIGY